MRHVLTSQLHRRFNPARAATTTQRRLKRLSDAGLVERFQFHRRDGGGIPMCYVITAAGLRAAGAARRAARRRRGRRGRRRSRPRARAAFASAHDDAAAPGSPRRPRRRLGARARRGSLGGAARRCADRRNRVLSPPTRSTRRRAGGARARRSAPAGRTHATRLPANRCRRASSVEVERFETVRPDAIVEVARCGRRSEPRHRRST